MKTFADCPNFKKKKDWQCFIGKLFELSKKKDFVLEHLGTEANTEESKLLFTTANLQICKKL